MLDTSCIRVSWHYPQRIINAAFGEFILARFLSVSWLGPNTLVTSDTKGGVEVWDTSNANKPPTSIKIIPVAGLGAAITAVGVGGGQIAVVTTKGTNLYKLVDGKVGEPNTEQIGKGDQFVAISFGGKYIALGNSNGVLDEFQLDNLSRHQVKTFKSLSSVAYSPDGKYLVFSADDGKVYAYKPGTLEEGEPVNTYH